MTSIKMIQTGLASVAVATMATTGLQIALPSVAHAQASNDEKVVVMSIGRSRKLDYNQNITDITLSNPGIATVEAKSSRQVFVHAKAPGESMIYLQNSSGKIVDQFLIRVGQNLSSMDQMLSLAMPEADIMITKMNGVVLLTGTVAQPEDITEAERLVAAFAGGQTEVVSRLKTSTPLQVNLQVRFAEVSRSLAKEIASNLQTTKVNNNSILGSAQGRDFISENDAGESVINFPDGENTIAGIGKLFGFDIAAAFDMSERAGLTTTLATPNLTTVSGETATFQAGGSFPIPQASGLGATTVQFQDYGVILEYTPTVLSDGRISIRVKPEVSDITSQGAVSLNGFEIPAISTRTVETTVELGSGQSMMIAGLMQNNLSSAIDKIPGAGDIPILGSLFRSPSWRKNETELVIVITPYLVKPVSSDKIKLPTDGFHSPNDAQRIFTDSVAAKGSKQRPGPSLKKSAQKSPEFKSVSQAKPALPAANKPKQAKAKAANAGFSFNK